MIIENDINKNIEIIEVIEEKPIETNPPLLEVNVVDKVGVIAVGPGQI